MRSAGILIASASIGGIALIAWGTMSRVSHDIEEAFGDWPFIPADLVGEKASAESFGAGRAEMGADLRVTNANQLQTEQIQTNSTHSKPPVTPGRIGQ